MADEQKKLSMDEALAILDRHAAEDEAAAAPVAPQKKKVTKVKDLLKEGAKARSGLGSAKRQLDQLDKEGY
jgi:hypothetical protein